MSAKIALIAGGGSLPFEFIKAAKAKGETVVVFAGIGMADPEIEKAADKIYWMHFGEWAKFIMLMIKEGLRKIAFIGRIKKDVIYKTDNYDAAGKDVLKKFKSRKDYSILGDITDRLAKIGVSVLSASDYLAHLSPEKGVLTGNIDRELEEDIEFGYEIAKKLAGMDVGQTVIIKDKNVVSVEASEGTDNTIERASGVAGAGCVMVKVSRPDQDMRWDVPTIGPETIKKLAENKYRGIAIESGKMFIVDREKTIEMAKAAGISIKVL
jgi:DUF1009 family protein